jgi:predicted ribosome quality control (RQC) complex YloA/Tae2 family protein
MKFREFKTSIGSPVLIGKDENSNDELMEKFQGKNRIVLHTAAPGSPFAVIDIAPSKVLAKEKKEVATFVAMKSQDWRDNKKDVKVDVFNAKDVYKDKKMKSGTWGVRKKGKPIIVKKLDIEKW